MKEPFKAYLRSSVSLLEQLFKGLGVSEKYIDEKTMDELLEMAFERYWQTSALLGTKRDCEMLIRKLSSIGITEIACLIDFGVDEDKVMNSLIHLNDLRKMFEQACHFDR